MLSAVCRFHILYDYYNSLVYVYLYSLCIFLYMYFRFGGRYIGFSDALQH